MGRLSFRDAAMSETLPERTSITKVYLAPDNPKERLVEHWHCNDCGGVMMEPHDGYCGKCGRS